ncbi:hypothetical protein QJS66_17315 [Kocuria rhizophila]|nr:hypothetical protein QJS66_17315 [Kocuria rhizophila]
MVWIASANVDYLQYFKDKGLSTETATKAADQAAGVGRHRRHSGGCRHRGPLPAGLHVPEEVRTGPSWTVFVAIVIVPVQRVRSWASTRAVEDHHHCAGLSPS